MDLFWFVEHQKPKLKAPIFVEGLPGVGHVGKLAAQQVVATHKAVLWLDIYSRDFPPQVTVQADGTARLVRCQLWTVAAKGKQKPLVIMTGDAQPLSNHGQYGLVSEVLDRIEALGCKEIYTLGGYATGSRPEKPEVLAAGSDAKTVARLKELGIRTPADEEDEVPGGGIIGASGLFIGMGALRNMSGVCLMGETNGYMVDPKAARAVLDALATCLGRPVDTSQLEKRAGELDRITQQIHESLGAGRKEAPPDLHYIG